MEKLDIYLFDGWLYRKKNNIYFKVKKINKPIKKNINYIVFKTKFGEIIKINNSLFILKSKTILELKNLKYYTINPILSRIKNIINNKNMKKKKLLKYVKIEDKVITLEDISFLHNPNLFMMKKLNGITCIIGFLNIGVYVFDTKEKSLYIDKKYKSKVERVFIGEYLNKSKKIYIFREANSSQKNFIIDNKMVEKYVSKYNKLDKIDFIDIKIGRKYLTNIPTLLKQKNIDGIIFGDIYSNIRYKWKKNITIDFYIKITGSIIEFYIGNIKKNNGKKWFGKGKYVHELYHTQTIEEVDDDEWYKFNNNIVECFYRRNKWKPIRIRADKKFANNILTVISNIKMIKNPITLDDLLRL
jgi:hypothetical protein